MLLIFLIVFDKLTTEKVEKLILIKLIKLIKLLKEKFDKKIKVGDI